MNSFTKSFRDFERSQTILPLIPANNNCEFVADQHLLSIGYRLAALIRVNQAIETGLSPAESGAQSVSSEIDKKMRSLAGELISAKAETYDGLIIKACLVEYASRHGLRNIFQSDDSSFSMLDELVNINSIAN